MNYIKRVALAILNRFFPPERPSDEELIAYGRELGRQEMLSQGKPPYSYPGEEERHTDQVSIPPVIPGTLQTGEMMALWREWKREHPDHGFTEQLPSIRKQQQRERHT